MYISGLPQGHEKLKKLQKSGKNKGFWKKVKTFDKIKTDFVSLNLQNSLFSKAFNW